VHAPVLQNLQAGWYGADGGRTKCHDKYPKGAPQAICGHISLIELDGQMAYKQALAFWATGDEQYARNAFEIIDSWAKVGYFKLWDECRLQQVLYGQLHRAIECHCCMVLAWALDAPCSTA
jgi:hypothetical protein